MSRSVQRIVAASVCTTAAALLSACGGIATQGGADDAVSLRVTTMLPPDGAASDLIDWFVEELESRSDGQVDASVTYSGALLSGADTLPGLVQGRAEAGLISPAYFPAEMPLNNVMMVPVGVQDREAHVRALDDLVTNVDEFADEFESNGVVPIGYFPTATMTVTFNEDVESLADAARMKLRIPSQPQAVVWEELGIEPMFLASEEVYESVERGIINGVAYPLDTQVANGITEVANIIAPDVGASGGSVFAMSKSAFQELPDEIRSIVEELQSEWYDKGVELTIGYEREACETFKAAGGEILLWSDADQERIAAATKVAAPQEVWQADATEAGADPAVIEAVWTQFNESLAKYAENSTYPGLDECAAQ